jgi:GGDEF domain-containing protein
MVYNPFLNTTEKKKFQNLSKNKYDNELLKRADFAMYRAKDAGKNGIYFYGL